MDELMRKVKKELETIGDKGLTSSNLDTTYKLIDIYKDIKEACYYDTKVEKMEHEDEDSYGARRRDGRGRYMNSDEHWDNSRSYPLKDRDERYLNRVREGIYTYNEGKERYRDGEGKERMLEGVEMAMGALVNFVEYMMDYAETNQEKEVVRKYIEKMKKL